MKTLQNFKINTMPDQKNSSIKILLVVLGVIMIFVVLIAVDVFTKGVGVEAPSLKHTDDVKPVVYTQEELQLALDKSAESVESRDQEGDSPQVKIDPTVEQKQLREVLTVLAPEEEVTNYSQDELEKALRQ